VQCYLLLFFLAKSFFLPFSKSKKANSSWLFFLQRAGESKSKGANHSLCSFYQIAKEGIAVGRSFFKEQIALSALFKEQKSELLLVALLAKNARANYS